MSISFHASHRSIACMTCILYIAYTQMTCITYKRTQHTTNTLHRAMCNTTSPFHAWRRALLFQQVGVSQEFPECHYHILDGAMCSTTPLFYAGAPAVFLEQIGISEFLECRHRVLRRAMCDVLSLCGGTCNSTSRQPTTVYFGFISLEFQNFLNVVIVFYIGQCAMRQT